VELECYEEVLEISILGLEGEDARVQEACIDSLGALAKSLLSNVALVKLLSFKDSELEYIRVRLAYTLMQFDTEEAKEAMSMFRQDSDYRRLRRSGTAL
jgi:hypothetical protein